MGKLFAEPLKFEQKLFCAADAGTLEPQVVVEAATLQQAEQRLRAVVGWFRLGSWDDLVVTAYEGTCGRVPEFFAAFFASWDPALYDAASASDTAGEQ